MNTTPNEERACYERAAKDAAMRAIVYQALIIARHTLNRWQLRYAEWSHSMPTAFDKRLPPSDHISALEDIDAAIRALPLTTESEGYYENIPMGPVGTGPQGARVEESAPAQSSTAEMSSVSSHEDAGQGEIAQGAAHIPTDAEAIEAEQLSEATAAPLEPVAWADLNLNDVVRYKLTSRGLTIHRQIWESYSLPSRRYSPPKVDSDGWSETQLWCLFQDFGPYTSLGAIPCIETGIQVKTIPPATLLCGRR